MRVVAPLAMPFPCAPPHETEAFLKDCTAERIYVTAFSAISDFRK
jgi:hypothetical protein